MASRRGKRAPKTLSTRTSPGQPKTGPSRNLPRGIASDGGNKPNLQRHPVSGIACAGGSRLHGEPISSAAFPMPTIRSADFQVGVREASSSRRVSQLKLATRGFTVAPCLMCSKKKGATFAFCDISCRSRQMQLRDEFIRALRSSTTSGRSKCSFRAAHSSTLRLHEGALRRSALTKPSSRQVQLQLPRICRGCSCRAANPVLQFSERLSSTPPEQCDDVGVRPDRPSGTAPSRQGTSRLQISGLNLAVLSDYRGLTISQTSSRILKQPGSDVRPE